MRTYPGRTGRARGVPTAAQTAVQLALRGLIADTRGVTVGAAFVAIVVAFAAGWLMRRWRASENTLRLTRRAADTAGGNAWRAQLWFAGAALIIWGLADIWIHSH